MEEISVESSKVLAIYLELSQFPVLADEIRQRMREELYRRRVISPGEFEQEVEEKAIQSQRREGLTDPYGQETQETWQQRIQIITDNLTDFYFAYNLPHDLLQTIVQETLRKQPVHPEAVLTFNPELAPWAMLFQKIESYEKLPPQERAKFAHHMQEIQVVITKGLISDHLRFLGISRQYFTSQDLQNVLNHRVGRGKIGGKAAGMYLAYKILTRPEPDDQIDLSQYVKMPKSYYIGADVYYDYQAKNGFQPYMNQKYKSVEEISAEFPAIRQAYVDGLLPDRAVAQLQNILAKMRGKSLIVRSSSLLEDRFDTSFAGKYDSFFCPNQGTDEENLEDLRCAIKQVYASTLSPDALLYRKNMGLLDYDERMAILIQEVVGERYGDYFFPPLAGVGFSHNPFRWSPRIKAKTGLLRLVWGLGTRAVDRVSDDYPRMIALSHPMLRPEAGRTEIRRYSQRFVDVVNLAENRCETLPVTDVLRDDYPSVQLLVSVDHGDYLQPAVSLGSGLEPDKMVLTFDNLLKYTNFVAVMRAILKKLQKMYKTPVDIEYAVRILPGYPQPDFEVYILQCRPLSEHTFMEKVVYPVDVPPKDTVFTTCKWMPSGCVSDIRYIVYVEPEAYNRLPDYAAKAEVGRAVSRINKALADERFILLGPGRWGSSNIDLGVKVTYADIYNTAILGEIAVPQGKDTPEVSFGTHFFQDLVEAKIYPLPIYPGEAGGFFNDRFFDGASNALADISPRDELLAGCIKVVDVPAAGDGRWLEVVMDGKNERAIAWLKPPSIEDDFEEDDA